MRMKNCIPVMICAVIACGLSACKQKQPATDVVDPPAASAVASSSATLKAPDPGTIDIIKTQREDLQKARAVSDVQEKAVDQQRKDVDDATK